MDKKFIKKAFRSCMVYTPNFIHKRLTKIKIQEVGRHKMTPEEVQKGESDPIIRKDLVEQYTHKFPHKSAQFDACINDLIEKKAPCLMDEENRDSICEDIRFCCFAYGMYPHEYVFYDFAGKNKDAKNRGQFISDVERIQIHLSADDFTQTVYGDKATAYEMLKKYYKRDAIAVKGKKDYQAFCEFVRKHPCFVKKEVNLSMGRGVALVDIEQLHVDYKQYFDELLTHGTVLLEEAITQSKEMAKYNSSSVNTVRINTFYTQNGIVAPFSFMRTGKDGSFVDNAGAGGIMVAVDVNRGMVCTDGCDEYGNRYEKHPNSGVEFNGFMLPEWESAVQLCKEAAALTPKMKYLGWDLAHTDRGWVLVEVNTAGQFLVQACTRQGVRDETRALIENMDLLAPVNL